MANKTYYLYIASDDDTNVLYTGICDNLKQRMQDHVTGNVPEHLKEHNISKLLYFEAYTDIVKVREREIELKSVAKEAKLAMVTKANPNLKDLTGKTYI